MRSLDLHGAQLTQDVFARRSPMGNATTSGSFFSKSQTCWKNDHLDEVID
jgi:hypothetical protein